MLPEGTHGGETLRHWQQGPGYIRISDDSRVFVQSVELDSRCAPRKIFKTWHTLEKK